MKFNELILKNIKYNIRNYIAYLLGTSAVLSILFMFFNFIYSDTFLEKSKEIFIKGYEKNIIIGIMTLFLMAFIIYITVTFTKTRGKELGVYYTIGLTSKEILRILFYENIVISGISISIGLIVGILFSRLFNMAFLKVMDIDNVNIGVNIVGLLSVVLVGLLIFLINHLYQKILLRRNSIVELIKFSSKKEVARKGVFVKGIVSAIAFVVSYNKIIECIGGASNITKYTVVFAIVAIASLYFLIGFFMALVEVILKKFKKIYNNNIVTIRTLSSKFLSYRSTIFISIIMTAAGMFFIIQGVSFYKLGGMYIDRDYKSDLSIIVNKKQLDGNDFKSIIEKYAGKIKAYNELENIEEQYIEKNPEAGYNIRALRIISNETYNKTTKLTKELKENEVIAPIEEGRNINGDLTLKLITKGKAINTNYFIDFISNLDKYKKENNNKYLEFNQKNIAHEKMKLSNEIYDCISDMRPGFLVLNNKVYNEIKSNLDPENVYYDILVDLESDHDYKRINQELKEELKKIGGEELAETLNIKSNSRHIEMSKSSFIFFTFFFLGVIFLTGSGAILYFKIFTSLDEDKQRKNSFNRIGLTTTEIRKIISKEIRIIFLVPSIIALVITAIILMKMYNQMNEGKVPQIIMLYMFMGYSIVYLSIYEISRRAYLKKVFSSR
ncbi:FtsX-like permease family protein [Inconstantimicrobium mannanitabidum]|uniref:Peptide ABC transporter Pep4E family, permease n=1 Tax=Inconstantimicrobium mannanitabidum TaxID=1604901 RepID=A0ACB5REF6_9CLOT|nr:FtsX-like permease family protein [Clostridium sp. TW13]GKX67658.1 peptide ABC transporter Pep4E family, permease [Clostridium sp. TW13]